MALFWPGIILCLAHSCLLLFCAGQTYLQAGPLRAVPLLAPSLYVLLLLPLLRQHRPLFLYPFLLHTAAFCCAACAVLLLCPVLPAPEMAPCFAALCFAHSVTSCCHAHAGSDVQRDRESRGSGPRFVLTSHDVTMQSVVWAGPRSVGKASQLPSGLVGGLALLGLPDAQARVGAAQHLQQLARGGGAHAARRGGAHVAQAGNLLLLFSVTPSGTSREPIPR